MNNIIFGLYSGYDSVITSKGGIHYFIRSLRKYNTTCKVVIVCEKDKCINAVCGLAIDMDFEIYTNFETKYGLQQYRYEIYNKYLSETSEKFDKILLSDVNDVIFQGDPFSIHFTEEIYCALECNILSSESQSQSVLCNMCWINSYNNCEKNYADFENKNVVCSGTILGTYEGIKKFLHFYCEKQSKNPIDIYGIDQGIYIIYVYNYLSSKHLLDYRQSRILTLDNVSFDTLRRDCNGYILNDNGDRYCIIHQIDRCNFNYMKSLLK